MILGPAIFFFLFFGVFVLGFVFWVVKIVEIAGIPDHQFRAAHTEKLTWILVVALTSWIGALVWQFAKRDDVLAMAGVLPPPPPGWYPEPGSDAVRWWDGSRWTEHRHVPPR